MTTCHDIYEYIPEEAATAGRIVVGVDGSPASRAALRWARHQAALTGGAVTAVDVYEPAPYVGFGAAAVPPLTPVDPERLRGSVQASLDDIVVEALGSDDESVIRVVVENPSPGKALVHAAEGASVLVVGATHHHGLGHLLGSTASGCIRHAECPVVVVPEKWSPSTSSF